MPDKELSREEISRLIYTDDLTGLYNRRYMYQCLTDDVDWQAESAPVFSLIMLDLDNFKAVNDNYGHLEGDNLLKHTAEILGRSFREQDIVIRYAGDEFSIILPDTSREDALQLAEGARSALEESDYAADKDAIKGVIHFSAGVAVFPEDARGAEELIDKADKALYFSKHRGRNTVSDFRELEGKKEEIPTTPEITPFRLYSGTQKQLTSVIELAGEISNGQNPFVFIKAPSEAGKIRFLGELVRQMEGVDTQCIIESCREHEKKVPYRALTEMLDKFLARNVEDTRRVRNTLSFDEFNVLARELPTLARAGGDVDAAAGLSLLLQRFTLFDAMTKTLAALSQEQVVCIILDEFQFVDEGTLNVILSMVRNTESGRVILCGAYQVEPGDQGEITDSAVAKFLQAASEQHQIREIVLEPLGLRDVTNFITQLLPGREQAEKFDHLIWETSKGSPLYIEMAIQMLKSNQTICFENEQWMLKHITRDDIPASLDEMILRQISDLDEQAARIITEAAVIGTDFRLDVLGRISGMNEGEVLDVLDTVKRMGLLENSGGLNDDDMKFVSSNAHDVTYESADAEFRTATHGRVAEVLEDLYSDNLGQAAFALAYHHQAAGNEKKANEYIQMGEERAGLIYDSDQIGEHALGKGLKTKIPECTEELSEEQISAVVQALQPLSRASKSLQMYPEGSQLITQAIDQLQDAISGVLEAVDGFTIGQSKEGMLINGFLAESRGAGMIGADIVKTLDERSIQSFTIIREASNEELLAFARIFGAPPPRGIIDRNHWNDALEEAEISHIGVVQEAYILDASKAAMAGAHGRQFHEPLSGEALLKACMLVRRMNGVVEKMVLYPPGSSIIASSLDQLAKAAKEFHADSEGFTLSEIEGELLINGVPPGAKAFGSGAADFARLLQKIGVKSIIVSRDASTEEMAAFLGLLSSTSEPRPIEDWQSLLAEKKVANVQVGETMYTGAAPGAAARTKPKEKPKEEEKEDEEEESDDENVNKARELCGYEPDQLLLPEVAMTVPKLLQGLIAVRESSLIGKLVDKFTALFSSEDMAQRTQAAAALEAIYQKSAVPVREVLVMLMRDAVVNALEVEEEHDPYIGLIDIADQIARHCAEMKDLENLKRMVFAMHRSSEQKEDHELDKISSEALMRLFNSADFKPLMLEINSSDAETKQYILEILGGFGTPAVPALAKLIKESENEETRRLAARAIRDAGPEAATRLSRDLTRYAPAVSSARVLSVLDETGADIAQAVRQTVVHPNADVRAESIRLLKGLEAETAVEMLLNQARAKDIESVVFAAAALGELGHAEAVSGLAGILRKHSEPEAQQAVCSALGKIGEEEAIPALTDILQAKKFFGLMNAFPDSVRAAAAEAMAGIGGEAAVRALAPFRSDKNAAVKTAAGQVTE